MEMVFFSYLLGAHPPHLVLDSWTRKWICIGNKIDYLFFGQQLYPGLGGGEDLSDSPEATFTDIWLNLLEVALTNHSLSHGEA